MINLRMHESFKKMKHVSQREAEAQNKYIHFNEFEIGSNADTAFIPWYSFFFREYIVDTKDVYAYHKPKPMVNGTTSISQYDDLFTVLNNKQLNGGVFYFTIAGEQKKIWVYNGYILDENFNSLMVLTVKDYYSMEPDNCRILISSEFITNPIYKNVWKKIESDYIGDAYVKDIEVRTINSKRIDKMLFPSKPPIVYDNLTELKDMMMGMNHYFNPDTFMPPIMASGLNQRVVPLLDDNHDLSNLMITLGGNPKMDLIKDFNDERLGDETILAVDLNKSFNNFEELLQYAYNYSVGSIMKFSVRMRTYVSSRIQFTLDTTNNSLLCHYSGSVFQLETVDYNVIANYDNAQSQLVQENVNFEDESVEDNSPF